MNVYLDCGLIDTASGAAHTFTQSWADSISGISYLLNTGNPFTRLVLSPFINDFTSDQFFGNYLDTINFYYRYQNSGFCDAHLYFLFNPNTSDTCSNDTMLSIKYAVSDTSAAAYTPLGAGWVFAKIPVDSFLVIRKTVILKGCVTACNPERADFRWRCAYDTLGTFCDKCQQNYPANKDFVLLSDAADTLGVGIRLVDPTYFTTQFDTSCMNSKTQFEYHIINGKRNVPTATIDLYYGNANGFLVGPRFLTLIDSAALVISQYCHHCITDTEYRYNYLALCHDSIPTALNEVIISMKNFLKGDSVVISGQYYRCAENTDSLLLDGPKYYNEWGIAATVRDTCVGQADSALRMSSNSYTGLPNFDQHLEFFPLVTDLTGAP